MFAKTEINTGRQIEFDYLKGWFIPLILLIHSFQLMGGSIAETPAYKVVYIVNNGEDKLYSDIYEVKVKNVLDFVFYIVLLRV